jgi:hypothetical protein
VVVSGGSPFFVRGGEVRRMPFLFYTISRIRKNASGKNVFAKKLLTFCFSASKSRNSGKNICAIENLAIKQGNFSMKKTESCSARRA